MTFLGMDLAAVQRGASAMSSQAEGLAILVGQLDGALANATALWPGPDCEAFQNVWFAQHRPALAAASDELAAKALWLLAQMQDQADASGMSADQVRAIGLEPCVAPDGPTTQELLDLSDGANSQTGDVGTWHRLTDAELRELGIDPSMLRDRESGFSASVFRNPDGQVVVSYEGTHEWAEVRLGIRGPYLAPGSDFQADLDGSYNLSRQSEQAVALALALRGSVDPGFLTFTGHSLGGRLAALSSIATGAPVETFNAAGVGRSEQMYAHIAGGGDGSSFGAWFGSYFSSDEHALGIDTSNIVNHQGDDDPLSRFQDAPGVPNAVGTQHYYEINAGDPLHAHSLDALAEQI